jgi:hypothetical protein
VQACRRLLVVLSVLLLHQLVLLGLSLGSLLLLSALGLLLLDGLLVVVALVGGSGGLALATLLGLATLGVSGLALLEIVSVRFEWTNGVLAYHRGVQVGDVLACGLARLLDLLLLLVDHDLARLCGTAFREGELRPRNRTSPGDDLEEETDLYGVSWSSACLRLGDAFSYLLGVGPTFGGTLLSHGK